VSVFDEKTTEIPIPGKKSNIVHVQFQTQERRVRKTDSTPAEVHSIASSNRKQKRTQTSIINRPFSMWVLQLATLGALLFLSLWLL
jgi:hypothetical protein